MRRRSFLSSSVAALPLAFTKYGSGAPLHQLFTQLSGDREDRILVLIQLIGGNDGLNTIVPLSQYADLAAVRPHVILPENKLVTFDGDYAMHPAFAKTQSLYDAGELAIVQNVGYPDQNRSHFRSADIWNTASASNEFLSTGWLGRQLQEDHPNFPAGYPNNQFEDPLAISVGRTVSETCQGTVTNFALTLADPLNATNIFETSAGASLATKRGRELDFLRNTIAQANQYGAIVERKARSGQTLADYPKQNSLAQRLRHVARMISGGLTTKIYHIAFGGFDTHANQVDAGDHTAGDHAELLQKVSSALAAFQSDLKALGLSERVLGLTYSEFGRRIRSNGALGTDHGSAAPMFMFGPCVVGGMHGDAPIIDRGVDEQEGLAMQYDFRDVYGTVLQDWFGIDEGDVRDVLYEQYTRLPLLNNCGADTSSSNEQSIANKPGLTLHPGVFAEQTTLSIELQQSGRQRLDVFDAMGAHLETLFDRRLPAGHQQLGVDTQAYPRGAVVFRLQSGSQVSVRRGVKQ